MPKLPSYRNQSIDLQSKIIDWFLYMATSAFNELMILDENFSAPEFQANFGWPLRDEASRRSAKKFLDFADLSKDRS